MRRHYSGMQSRGTGLPGGVQAHHGELIQARLVDGQRHHLIHDSPQVQRVAGCEQAVHQLPQVPLQVEGQVCDRPAQR